jgi:hypothetical protein
LTGKLTIPQLAFDLIVDGWVGDLASTEMADHTFRITDHPPGTTVKKHVLRLGDMFARRTAALANL